MEMDEQRKRNELRTFYKDVNESRKSFKPRVRSCRKEDGSIITEKEEIMARRFRHFDSLLNEGAGSPDDFMIPGAEGDLDPPDPPTCEDVVDAIDKLNNNKAPGEDGIPSELLKQGGEEFQRAFYDIILAIWVEEKMPAQWKTGIIYPLHKKGNILMCDNYRGISLLQCAYKVH